MDFDLTKIEKPLNLIPKTLAGKYSEPNDFEFDEEGSNSEDMEDNNNNNG
jgi:hypothetical protein